MGIYVFTIAYGLMESANAIYVYRGDKNNKRNLFVIVFWGILIVLCSLVEIFKVSIIIKNTLYILFGVSWFPLISIPCTLKLFRKNEATRLIRKFIFIIVGLIQFIFVILNNI
jgi:hypothetical protein